MYHRSEKQVYVPGSQLVLYCSRALGHTWREEVIWPEWVLHDDARWIPPWLRHPNHLLLCTEKNHGRLVPPGPSDASHLRTHTFRALQPQLRMAIRSHWLVEHGVLEEEICRILVKGMFKHPFTFKLLGVAF